MKKLFGLAIFLTIAIVVQAQEVVVEVRSNVFTPKELTIQVGQTVRWNNVQGVHNVNGSQAAYPSNPASFGNGTAAGPPWTYDFTFAVPGVYEYRCDPHFALGMVGKVTVVGSNNMYPVYSIGKVTTNDAEGAADSLGVKCQLQGVVYGVNIRGEDNGLQFTVIDSGNNGIGVFSSTKDFDYTVTEGDEIIIQGTIDQFNGLTQIIPDTLWRISQNKPLVAPTIATDLNEATESQLIQLNNIRLLDADDWTNGGSGFNLDVTNGLDTFRMRIDADTDIFGLAAPSGTFTLRGIGSQFDNTSPYTSGYQIIPRYIQDIDPYVPTVAEFPLYPIGTVTTNAADGRPDSLGVKCELRGVVYGVNLRGSSGIQCTIIDNANNGIGVFNSNNNLGYTVKEGDQIAVRGVIGFFNGLTQINAEEIELLSANNALVAPSEVTALNESTESQLVKINGLTLVNPSQWTNAGSGFNVDVTNGITTFQMRVDADVNVFGTPAPVGAFNLTGIGGQFDSSSPYDAGYQIFPRYLEDIDFASSVLDPALIEGLKLYPNPVADWLTLESPLGFDQILIGNALGQQVQQFKNIDTKAQFDLSALPAGIYTLTLVRKDRMYALEIVKQ